MPLGLSGNNFRVFENFKRANLEHYPSDVSAISEVNNGQCLCNISLPQSNRYYSPKNSMYSDILTTGTKGYSIIQKYFNPEKDGENRETQVRLDRRVCARSTQRAFDRFCNGFTPGSF
jgi:hypothetical protein